MTFAYSLVALSALALVLLLLLAKGHWFARPKQVPGISGLQSIDVDAFRNLIDENEEAYLREHLSSVDFRRIHRERMRAAIEYVRAAYQNAGILVGVAESVRESSEEQLAEAGVRLFDNATQLRWYAAGVIPRLYLRMLFPGHSAAPRKLFERYDIITRQAIVIGRLGSAGRA